MSSERMINACAGVLFLLLVSAVAPAQTSFVLAQGSPPEAPSGTDQNLQKADPASFPDVVAKVNGFEIRRAELLSRTQAVRERVGLPEGDLPVQIYRTILDDMINLELLYQATRDSEFAASVTEVEQEFENLKEQFPSEEAFQGQLAAESMSPDDLKGLLQKDLSVQNLVEKKLAARVAVTDDSMRRFYEENQDQMRQPEQLRIRHLLVKLESGASPETMAEAERKIEGLRAQAINEASDFAELARLHSDDTGSREEGGEMTVSRGDTVKEFEEAAFRLKTGEISSVVRTRFGFHIIKLEEVLPARTLPFEDVAERIADYLRQEGVQHEVEAEVETLRSKASIALFI